MPKPSRPSIGWTGQTRPDPGPGTEVDPYCHIQAAANAHSGPEVTIKVKPATYAERVNVPGNGAANQPYKFVAAGTGVIVTGAGGAEAFFVPWNRSYVTIEGFTITAATGVPRGIYVRAGSTNIIIRKNTISGATSYGIHFDGVDNSTIEANVVSNNPGTAKGIALLGGSDNNLVQDNEVAYNGAQGFQFSGTNPDPPIDGDDTAGNTIQRNNAHHNGDSGFEFAGFGRNNISRLNRSWRNEQHGYDHNSATGNIHIGDVAWGNGTVDSKDGNGFNLENLSTATRIYNSISVNHSDNLGFNLEVSCNSTDQFVSDYNIWWNPGDLARIHWNVCPTGTIYDDVTAFAAATLNDTNGLEGDPLFVNATAGDFHLSDSSLAIDEANSSIADWPTNDAEGLRRWDDPSKTNGGAGSPAYADIGAYESFNRSFEFNENGWIPYDDTSPSCPNPAPTLLRVAGGQLGSWSLQVTAGGTQDTCQFGINDSANWVAVTPFVGARYRVTAYVKSDSHNGQARIRVREYLGGQQKGTTTLSAAVTLSPTWTQLTVDYVVVALGSTLDIQVRSGDRRRNLPDG